MSPQSPKPSQRLLASMQDPSKQRHTEGVPMPTRTFASSPTHCRTTLGSCTTLGFRVSRLLHPSSSVSSRQSAMPSHLREAEMHRPSLQRNTFPVFKPRDNLLSSSVHSRESDLRDRPGGAVVLSKVRLNVGATSLAALIASGLPLYGSPLTCVVFHPTGTPSLSACDPSSTPATTPSRHVTPVSVELNTRVRTSLQTNTNHIPMPK
mmetsp:Transcript_13428/g.29824  ORF Transcript_13428/g.29824 Transcript_13428/m.29824 type:complete len:207 (-) Transcript_13428:15-635(-)